MGSLGNFYIESNQGKPRGQIFHSILCLYAVLEEKISEYLAPYNLTTLKFNALILIKHKDPEQGLSQNEIGSHMIISPSNITRLLDSLNEDGYVKRYPSKEDRRVNLVKITPKGSEILDKVWPGYCDLIRKNVTLLSEAEISTLAPILVKWFSLLEKADS